MKLEIPRPFFLILENDLCEAVRVQIRYHTKNEDGETRTEYNARFGQSDKTPPLEIPEGGVVYWDWFWLVRNSIKSVIDGSANPIPPSEYLAWARMHNVIVRPSEFVIMAGMDRVFCETTNSEIRDYINKKFPPKPEGK